MQWDKQWEARDEDGDSVLAKAPGKTVNTSTEYLTTLVARNVNGTSIGWRGKRTATIAAGPATVCEKLFLED